MIKGLNLNVSGTKRDVASKQRPDRFPSVGDHIYITPTPNLIFYKVNLVTRKNFFEKFRVTKFYIFLFFKLLFRFIEILSS